MPSFNFPVAYDPQMHREDVLTLSRTTSSQNAITKVNGNASQLALAPAPAMTSKPQTKDSPPPPPPPQRRHYVFADPVAFRCVKAVFLHSFN
jgi:hypothetical protein